MPLKFVHRSDARAGDPVLKLEHLCVIGGDNQDVLKGDRFLDAVFVISVSAFIGNGRKTRLQLRSTWMTPMDNRRFR